MGLCSQYMGFNWLTGDNEIVKSTIWCFFVWTWWINHLKICPFWWKMMINQWMSVCNCITCFGEITSTPNLKFHVCWLKHQVGRVNLPLISLFLLYRYTSQNLVVPLFGGPPIPRFCWSQPFSSSLSFPHLVCRGTCAGKPNCWFSPWDSVDFS